ncbi:MAG TPA: cysteine hydrolase [Bacteroides sp.]|nr:cysteine hydrolase [Bacteroides sp.]
MRVGSLLLLILFLLPWDHALYGQRSALLLVDIQDFYFPGGNLQLENADMAGMNAGLLLEQFREEGMKVYHVRHNTASGGDIHSYVRPIPGEMVISKDQVNPFLGTGLLGILQADSIEQLVICGMQTHLCVEAAVRAAHDLGFCCFLVADACATRALQYEVHIIPAKNVHYSTIKTLEGTYATVISTQELLREFDQYLK